MSTRLRLTATATVALDGPPEAVATVLAQLAGLGTVHVQIAPSLLPSLVNPLDLPPGRRPKGRALDVLRLDLARQSTAQIAAELHIQPSTVRSIRLRLRDLLEPLPSAQRPLWLAGWFALRGYSGAE